MAHSNRPSRRTILKASATGVAGMSLAGCLGDEGSDEFNVAMLMPHTGPYAGIGENTTDAVRLAVQHYEEESDRSIELITADTQLDAGETTRALDEIHDSEGIDLLLGGLGSNVQISMGAWAQRNGVLYMAQAGSLAVSGSECQPNMYNMASATPQQQQPLYYIAENDLGDSVYHIYSDYTTGHSHQEWLEEYTAPEFGLELVGEAAVPLDATDLSTYMTDARDSGADVLFLMGYMEPQARMLNQAGEFDLHEEMLLSAPIVTMYVAGQVSQRVLDGGYFGSSWYWDMPDVPAAMEFSEAFREEFDETPVSTSAISYAGFMTAMDAMDEVGTTDPAELRDTLEGREITPQIWGIGEYLRGCDHQAMGVNPVKRGLSEDEADRDNDQYFEIVHRDEDPERHWPDCDERDCDMAN